MKHLLLSTVLAACSVKPLVPAVVSTKAKAPSVLVVKSSENAQFDSIVENFAAQAPASVSAVTLGADEEPLVRLLSTKPPALVFTLGTRATQLVRDRFPQQPLIFAMVVSYHRLALGNANTLMGISLELPAAFELGQFKMVVPSMNVVTAFYNPSATSAFIHEAEEAAKGLGLTLNAVKVTSQAELTAAYEQHSKKTDAVWLLADPVVVNEQAFAFLQRSTLRDKKLLVAWFSSKFAEAGALMALSVDLSSMGAQAAAMAADLFRGERSAQQIGIVTPIGGRLFVNRKTARALHVTIPDDALPYFEYVMR